MCTSAYHHKVCTALQDGLMTPASERADLQCKLIPAVLSEVQHIHAPRAFSCLLVYSILVEMLNCCCMIRPDTICALRAYQRQGCVEPYGFAHQHASSRLPTHTDNYTGMAPCTNIQLRTCMHETQAARGSIEHGSSSQLMPAQWDHTKNLSLGLLHPGCCTLQCMHMNRARFAGWSVLTFLHLVHCRSCSW